MNAQETIEALFNTLELRGYAGSREIDIWEAIERTARQEKLNIAKEHCIDVREIATGEWIKNS